MNVFEVRDQLVEVYNTNKDLIDKIPLFKSLPPLPRAVIEISNATHKKELYFKFVEKMQSEDDSNPFFLKAFDCRDYYKIDVNINHFLFRHALVSIEGLKNLKSEVLVEMLRIKQMQLYNQ
jgi:hypothetical protein